MPPRHIQIIILATLVSLACFHRSSHNRYATMIAEAMQKIDQWHVQPVDRRSLFEGALRGMVKSIDPYSGFIDSQQYARWKEELSQEFGGAGIIVVPDSKSGRPLVTRPVYQGPAYRLGIRPGDIIMSIDGRDTSEMDPEDWTRSIKGEPGTEVALSWLPVGKTEPREGKIIREIIPIESVLGDTRLDDGRWQFVLADHPQIGYVRISSFGDKTTSELKSALAGLSESNRALILDLRGNDGGLLRGAYEVCDFFLAQGLVVEVRGRTGNVEEKFEAQSENELVSKDLPIAVLIDRHSASAAEIVAAALQDHHRATIVGERSWGKGTVQHIFELEGGRSALRLTTATYWRPSGKNIHRAPVSKGTDEWGVRPDEGALIEVDQETFLRRLAWRAHRDGVLPLDPESPDSGPILEYHDVQLEKAVALLQDANKP
jgi:carboxyl-terminal processing protease